MKRNSRLSLRYTLLLLLIFSQILATGIFLRPNPLPVQAAAPAWHHSNWNFRKEIIIDHTKVETEDLSDYPFLFSVTDEAFKSPSNSGKLGKEDATDILFTKEDGTKLSHEIEEYDPQTGKIISWIKIPLLSHAQDTKLYIYYGNANASDQEDRQNVWKDSYKLVQHLGDETSTTTSDSTSNDNHGTKSGALEIDGKIGKAQSFDGSGHISINDHDSLDFHNSDWTISFWVKSQAGEDGEVLSKGHPGNKIEVRKTGEGNIWSLQDSFENTSFSSPTASWSDGTYLYIADKNNHRIVKRRAGDMSYVSQIGTNGSGIDQFSSPYDIWGNGNYLYVADSINHRIVKRRADDLSYVSHIGGTASGSGNDQFKFPYGITGDDTYLYIADSSNHRIVKRRADDLSYVSHIGGTASGTGINQFTSPDSVYADGTHLYIADAGNNRIVKRLASNLNYVSHVGGTWGSGNDQFKSPYGITGDGTYLYIADYGNNRIVKRLASDLSYVSQIGTLGSGNDQFVEFDGIFFYGAYLYIADSGNNRIVKRLASDLSYVSQIGLKYGAGNDQFNFPSDIWKDGTYLYVADTYNHRLVKRLASDLSYVSHIGGTVSGSGDDQFNYPYGIWGDGTYLYIADESNHRIVKRRADDLSYVSQIGTYGTGDSQFKSPRGIWGDGTYLYIADTNNHRLVKRLASDLSHVSHIGGTVSGSGDDQFKYPSGIWSDDTYLYIADKNNHRIVKRLASDLSYVSQIGTSGSGNDQFNYPYGIYGDGTYLYIADSSNHRIVKRRADDLSYVSHIGGTTSGTGNDRFHYPRGTGGDGTYLYIADESNHRIVKRLVSDLSYVSELNSASVTSYSSSLNTSYNKVAIVKSHPAHGPLTISIYVNGILDSSTSSTYSDDYVNNAENLFLGRYFSGELDELRLSTEALTLSLIKTEYSNQSSPQTFMTLSLEESIIDHFILTGSSAQVAGEAQDITISAMDPLGTTNTTYSGDRTINLSGPTSIGDFTPFFTDKNGNPVPFGSSATLTFTNGVAQTNITLYKAENAQISASDQTFSTTSSFGVEVTPSNPHNLSASYPSSITSETPFSLSLVAKDIYGNPTPSLTHPVNLSVSSGTISPSSVESALFAPSGTYSLSATISNIYQSTNIILTLTSADITKTYNLSVAGFSQGSVFLPPQKPIVTISDLISGTLPQGIIQIAISPSPDFKDSIFQEIDYQKLKDIPQTNTTLYLKFRTKEGGVSDVLTIHPTSTLLEGDIVKTPHHHDVFIIKYQNGKRYKRLILSPSVFNSYGHLKWENIKTVSQEELDKYQTSNLVQVKGDNNIYELTPEGDTGKRQIYADITKILKQVQDDTAGSGDDTAWDGKSLQDILDSIYEINQVDRDSYALVK